MNNKQEISTLIKTQAKNLGFDACGISKASRLPEESKILGKWLENGMHAGMSYMENHFEKRVDPTKLVENAKSVVSVLLNYSPSQSQKPGIPKFSKYAYGNDYHKVMKDKLFLLLAYIKKQTGELNGRAFVDSAPVMDKIWAAKAGLGWIGKNSCLINKNLGSFVFIGELIVDLELEYDQPTKDYCGTCTKCMDACPTQAIVAPKTIDSRKCISYYTIEHKGNIPKQIQNKLNGWAFGCDICQDVCPWNQKKAKPTNEKSFEPKPEILIYACLDWQNTPETKFKEIFEDSPVLRAGRESLLRNMLVDKKQ